MQSNGFSLPSTSGIQGITTGITSKIGRLDEAGSVSDAPTAEQAKGFQSLLADAIGSVNEAQDGAKKATESLMTGKAESLHEVQIAGAKAEIMMKLTTTVTSKLAQATTQLFQMQV
jgi:flagellar hook-basal body complex protein FliE